MCNQESCPLLVPLGLVSAALLEIGGMHVCTHVLLCMPSSACLRHLCRTDGTAEEQKRFNFSLHIVSALLIGVAVSLGVFGGRVPYVGVLCGIF